MWSELSILEVLSRWDKYITTKSVVLVKSGYHYHCSLISPLYSWQITHLFLFTLTGLEHDSDITIGVTSSAGTDLLPELFEFTLVMLSCFFVVLCRSLFVLWSVFFRPLCFLSFFDSRILITSFGIFQLFLVLNNNQSL